MEQALTGFKVKSTTEGLYLVGSILSLDSQSLSGMSFLSNALNYQATQNPSLVTTEETLKILEAWRKKPKALVCQYNRPFSIGRLKIELLPSGSILGGASLNVEIEPGRFVLYAPHILWQRNATARKLQLKKAQTLILGTNHPDPHCIMPKRRKEKDRLASAVKEAISRDEYPVILCSQVPTAQEICHLLNQQGISCAVHNRIYRLNRIYESCGSELGPFHLYHPRKGYKKPIILPVPAGLRARFPLPDGPLFYIEDSLSKSLPPQAFSAIDERFYISATSDPKDLREAIAEVSPEELYFFGPYAKSYVKAFADQAKEVRPLYQNGQPTLF